MKWEDPPLGQGHDEGTPWRGVKRRGRQVANALFDTGKVVGEQEKWCLNS